MGYRNYATANGLIVDKLGNGDFKTIAAALTAAVSGQTIFIRPGTYTENPTLKAGVNLVAYGPSFTYATNAATIPNVIISGTCTLTTAGTVGIDGICLQTNSAAALAVTGSAASIVILNKCFLNCTNTTGITFSSSSASSVVQLNYCGGDLGTTGIALFAHSSAGNLRFVHSSFSNTGGSTTNNTVSSTGNFFPNYSSWANGLTLSSSGFMVGDFLDLTMSGNQTALTTSGTTSINIQYCTITGGTSSAINIGAGTSVQLHYCFLNSSNASTITGTGTLSFTSLTANSTLSIDAGLTLSNSAMKSFQSLGGVGTSGQVWTSNGVSTPPSFQAASAGAVVQQTRGNSTTASTGTTTFTLGTTPTTAGGTQVLSASITPTNSSHILLIEYSYFAAYLETSNALSGLISAIFQDSTVNCIYSQIDTENSLGGANTSHTLNVTGRFYMTAGTTSSTTFKIRIGMYGSATNWYFLEDSAGTGMGGTQFASLTITEYTT